MVSTGGRSAMSPELLEVGFFAAIPRGRRTPVDVRRRDRWVEDGNNAGVDGPGVAAVEPGRERILLLGAVGVSPTRLARPAGIKAMAGMAQCRASRGGAEGRVVGCLGVPTPSPAHTSNQPLEQGSQPLVEWLMLKVGRGGWSGGVKRVRRVSGVRDSWGMVRASVLRGTRCGRA